MLWNSNSSCLIPSALVSGCCCSQWAGVQHWHARTDRGGQCFQTCFQTQSGNSNSRRHPCAFHTARCTQNDALLGADFPIFIYPLLFIPFYLSPSEARVTPLLSGVNLFKVLIHLTGLKILSEQLPVLHRIVSALQATDLAQFTQQAHPAPRGALCNEEIARTPD